MTGFLVVKKSEGKMSRCATKTIVIACLMALCSSARAEVSPNSVKSPVPYPPRGEESWTYPASAPTCVALILQLVAVPYDAKVVLRAFSGVPADDMPATIRTICQVLGAYGLHALPVQIGPEALGELDDYAVIVTVPMSGSAPRYAVFSKWKKGFFFILHPERSLNQGAMSTEEFCKEYTGKAILVSTTPITIPKEGRVLDFRKGSQPARVLAALVGLVLSVLYLCSVVLSRCFRGDAHEV